MASLTTVIGVVGQFYRGVGGGQMATYATLFLGFFETLCSDGLETLVVSILFSMRIKFVVR